MPKKATITIPDYIALSRIAASPILIVLLLKEYIIIAFILYAIAASSDIIDSIINSATNNETRFNRALDTLGDRILVVPAFLVLWFLGNIPAWCFVILLCYAALELIPGIWASVKCRMPYLFFPHRKSVEYFAVILFITLGAFILNFRFSYILLLASVPFAAYTFVDYMKYLQKHKKMG
jgi:phosphatidylglycerophosphate synthase